MSTADTSIIDLEVENLNVVNSTQSFKCLLCNPKNEQEITFSDKKSLNKHYESVHRDYNSSKIPCVCCAALQTSNSSSSNLIERKQMKGHYLRSHPAGCWENLHEIQDNLFLFPHPWYEIITSETNVIDVDAPKTTNTQKQPTKLEIDRAISDFTAKERVRFQKIVEDFKKTPIFQEIMKISGNDESRKNPGHSNGESRKRKRVSSKTQEEKDKKNAEINKLYDEAWEKSQKLKKERRKNNFFGIKEKLGYSNFDPNYISLDPEVNKKKHARIANYPMIQNSSSSSSSNPKIIEVKDDEDDATKEVFEVTSDVEIEEISSDDSEVECIDDDSEPDQKKRELILDRQNS